MTVNQLRVMLLNLDGNAPIRVRLATSDPDVTDSDVAEVEINYDGDSVELLDVVVVPADID